MTAIKDALVKAKHAIITGLLSTSLMLIKGALVKANDAIINGLLFNKVNVHKGCTC